MQKGSVNKVVIVGHIGADPETRFTPSGTAVANFNVATNESRKNSDGGYQDHTEWHSCVLFGKRAEFAGEYLKRGQLIYLEGRLQTRSWEDDSGTKKYKTEVIGNEITMLGKKVGTGDSSQNRDDASDDDLPF
ncbi:MAG: single-stranded DNA-binding protein [Candidatus Neomarinimicrobiota bacterium]|nr:single-stranded DNA-binding protein [Candidatus Neomarinimicrobiota bacterium]